MKLAIVGVLFYFFWLNANVAQEHYQLFEPDEKYMFQDEQGYMHPIRWDSVYIGNATDYFFNYRTFREDESAYFTDQGASWMGYGVRRFYGSQHNYIMLKDGEEMAIMIGGNPGQEFPMYEYPNGDVIWGKVNQIEEEIILGLTDSVKTIEIIKKDITGKDLPYFYNGFLIKVSKEHGMIQGLNFGEFPDGQMEIYTLAGQEKAEIGIGNMKFTEAFSMVPGDEIHVHGHAYVFNNSFDGKYIYDVLEKTFNSDNTEVYLSLKRCAYEIEVENEVVTERSFNDTIALVFNSFNPDEDPCFRFPPEYPDIPFGQDPRTYCRQYYSTIIGGRMVKSFGELYGPVDDLWSQYIDAECGDYYIEGLGQFYSFISPGGESYTEPVYYKQGNEEWGTPYACNDLLAVNEWQESGIEISPNPFWNNISIVLPFEKGHFRLYNSMGSLLVSSPLQSNKEEMDLHSLQKGIYFYSICYEQLSFSGKLIKLN